MRGLKKNRMKRGHQRNKDASKETKKQTHIATIFILNRAIQLFWKPTYLFCDGYEEMFWIVVLVFVMVLLLTLLRWLCLTSPTSSPLDSRRPRTVLKTGAGGEGAGAEAREGADKKHEWKKKEQNQEQEQVSPD